jgi:HipA-like protein
MSKNERYRIFGSTPPPKLFVSFAGKAIAELTEQKGFYCFKYLPAFTELNLAPIPGFPEEEKEYRSTSLFPFFAERIPDKRRPEIAQLLKERNLETASPFELLVQLGANAATNPYELSNAAA